MLEDTIAAISTPLGEGGIGIVRVSGPAAVKVAKKIFKARRGEWSGAAGNSLIYGHIYDFEGNMIDEVLLGYMKAPYTYTREDIVEINCHGGAMPLKKILGLTLAAGARLAKPGEFSMRAFLNGRMDLSQAEAVIDIIRSKTEDGLKLATGQLSGRLSDKIYMLQDRLLGILAQIEANIDFPDDDLEAEDMQEIALSVREIAGELQELIGSAEVGKIYRDGISTAIIGRPNVGKSSLLNALLKENRAIVTDIPGTTRDVIEEMVNIEGLPLKIIDTAGLHKTENVIEKIGIERTRNTIKKAGLILLVLDAAQDLTSEDLEIIHSVADKKTIFLINKVDIDEKKIDYNRIVACATERPVLWISAQKGAGLEQLKRTIYTTVLEGRIANTNEVLISSIRHQNALERADRHLADVRVGIENNVPVDIIAIDIKAAWEALGEITGSTVTEDLLDRIFTDFCIGK
ncbi:MAG: tRNA uridine-5-carboxymethylaminomethyl(34) synthesis GTPase MnmE [Peptococcaceae bacterium]|nr:tRNA uridine-5-carboxymethylaminomethyl(34) synthesis GTPase MnmE [Candidatus Syntrophopropionicum ammoniitolerans]